MIKVDTYKYIKDLHIKERKSIRQISRETGLARQTIRKILYGSVEEVLKPTLFDGHLATVIDGSPTLPNKVA